MKSLFVSAFLLLGATCASQAQVSPTKPLSDPDNAAQFISTFEVPSSDTGIPGAYWWRVDIIDAFSARRTVNSGPLLVEAV